MCLLELLKSFEKNFIKKCLFAARKTFNKIKNPLPRLISIPKTGGMLQLIYIFDGHSALGVGAVAKLFG